MGTGNSNKDITGLRAAVDDSTFVTTFEGISRATYTQWRSTITSDSSLAIADMATDFNAAKVGAEDPTLLLSTPAVFNIYEALMDQDVRYNLSFTGYDQIYGKGLPRKSGNLAQGQGFNSLYFRGIPLVADEKCTTGRLYTLNEGHVFFHTFSNLPNAKSIKNGFGWTGLKEPVNQDGSVNITAELKSLLIKLGTSVLTTIVGALDKVCYTGKYDNPQQAGENRAVATTERRELGAFSFGYATV